LRASLVEGTIEKARLLPLSGVTTKTAQSSKNGHLHITPETAPRRINSLAETAGGRIHIGNIYRRQSWHLGQNRPGGTGRPSVHRPGKKHPKFPSVRTHEIGSLMRIEEGRIHPASTETRQMDVARSHVCDSTSANIPIMP